MARKVRHPHAFPYGKIGRMSKETNVVVILLDEHQCGYVEGYYSPGRQANPNPYVRFAAKAPECSVTLYEKKDKDGKRKCVFQGLGAMKESALLGIVPESAKESKAKTSPKATKPTALILPQIGSDEVGTGDFFGPVIVCAAYVDETGYKTLKRLGVTDSKAMDDDYILKIGAELSLSFDHSLLILPNGKYNEVQTSGLNMNAIKAKMHNRCLINVLKKHPRTALFQDQFAEEGLYYHYLRDEDRIAKNITFATKGETKFPSVALASVIARYAFLMKMKEMGEELGKKIPLGAGKDVDAFAKKLANARGKEALLPYVKANFANYKKI